MFRKSALAMAMLGAFASTQVVALGLGEIELNSALNQPFNAEVELLSATDAELEELKVNIGSAEAFAKAGIERPMFLSKLKFDVTRKPDGSAVVRVTSREAVREPFLDFLMELSWSKGRLLREYTVLVDPPVTMPAPAPVAQAPAQAAAPAAAPAVTRTVPQRQPVYAAPGEYGPTKRNDTLWNIAKQVRPDAGVSVEQTMLGLQRTNPEAFVNNNINNLKAGYVLRVPSREQLTSISRGEAARNARAQYDAWRAARSTSVAAAVPADSISASESVQASADPVSVPESSLQLVSPEEAGAGGAGEGALEQMQRELIMANEALEEQRRQGEEMSGRLSMLEEQITNMQRLIQLKDGELARLQAQSSIEGLESAEVVEGEQVEEIETAAEIPVEETEVAAEGVDVEATEVPVEAGMTEEAGVETETSVIADAGEASMASEMPIEPEVEGEMLAGDGTEAEFVDETAINEVAVVPAEPDAAEVVEPDAAEVVEPAAEPAPPVTATSSEFIQRLLDNPLWLGAGGVVLALLAFFGLRRKRGVETEFQESILQAVQEDSTLGESEIVSSGSDASQGKTAESSLLSEFAVSDMGSLKSDGEADPLAEADVYLAYGRFQQAEDLIKDALQKDSEREDLNLKLLEVFLAGKNQSAFDGHAQEMLAKLENTSSPVWEKIAEMGRELSPGNPLYQADEAPEAGDDMGDIDSLSDEDLDFNINSEEVEQPDVAASDTKAEETEDEGLDFDIDLSFEPAKEDEPDSAEFTPPDVVDEDTQVNVDPEVNVDMDSVEPDMVDQDSPLDIDLEDFDMEVGDIADEEEVQGDGELADMDEVSTKLDLARAYVDMGDPDGAKSILDEVMEEGNEEQKDEARGILGQMA